MGSHAKCGALRPLPPCTVKFLLVLTRDTEPPFQPSVYAFGCLAATPALWLARELMTGTDIEVAARRPELGRPPVSQRGYLPTHRAGFALQLVTVTFMFCVGGGITRPANAPATAARVCARSCAR